MNRDHFSKENNHVGNNRVKLMHSGAEFFQQLLQLINGAASSIHLQTYIFENDETGQMIADALMAATPVGATMAIFLKQVSRTYFRKVLFPVRALPVKNIFLPVSLTKCNPN